MSAKFQPTAEQAAIIHCNGAAYVSACPGAGKTRVLVERARKIRSDHSDRRGVAFLSFTNTAVSELESRLRAEGLIEIPAYPSFVGTFDSFVWQFLIAPFPIKGRNLARLIPDKNEQRVLAGKGNRSLQLKCFDRSNWTIKPREAAEIGVKLSELSQDTLSLYSKNARELVERTIHNGCLDFEDARFVALARLANENFGSTFGRALSARFREVIIDEAQDCNDGDLKIIQSLCANGVPIKVVCDPNQAIFGFRGGAGDALPQFAASFNASILPMTGNFRSTRSICRAVSALRPLSSRGQSDEALGKYKNLTFPVHVISYDGNEVTSAIGTKFGDLIAPVGANTWDCPVLSSTGSSAAKAAGRDTVEGDSMTLSLAKLVRDFYESDGHQKASALRELDRLLLRISEKLPDNQTYHEYLASLGETDQSRRPELLVLMRQLEFGTMDANAWLDQAKKILAAYAPSTGSIGHKLRSHPKLDTVFSSERGKLPLHARTIHSVKGMQFPAVCVVLTTHSGGALRYIEKGTDAEHAEGARKLYVAASRAEQMLVMAAPKSQAETLVRWFKNAQAEVELHAI